MRGILSMPLLINTIDMMVHSDGFKIVRVRVSVHAAN